MKQFLIIACCLAITLCTKAQRTDTLACGYNHTMSFGQCVAPASLTLAGSVVAFTPLNETIDLGLHHHLQADGHARHEVENYIQYLPMATPWILKACGIESRHGWRDMACLEGGSCLITAVLTQGLKHTIRRERPYGGVYNSFPSGHTAVAFMGAEILRREYGESYPAIAVAGYTVATGVGLMRIYNNRHWASDVLAGVGIGILSASLTYWLAPYLQF